MKPDINSGEDHPQLGHIRHPVDGALVGAGSLWSVPLGFNTRKRTLKWLIMPDSPTYCVPLAWQNSPPGASCGPGPSGWSEPAATNAPVEDEPVQPVLRMNILPARRDFFFHLLSAPKFSTSPLLPTTYQPHPPHSITRAPETSSGCGAGPTRPRKGKMLTFFFCFFCLKKA